ncbi:MAG: hypothetical protein AAB539_03745 [Patescibacteria group bacterium]
MGYLQDLDGAFRERLNDILAHQAVGRSVAAEADAFVRFAKEKVLESYRNGQQSGEKVEQDSQATRKPKPFARQKSDKQDHARVAQIGTP